ncbi:MAG: hypothetical protein VX343_04155 [Thermodesulfobacteriota bacterium]|nr:hypothetical protein [Thermodesulfobacteriota bacterium]
MNRIKEDDITNSYFITSANWEIVIISSSFDKAVSQALEKMFKEYGKFLQLSPAIIVIDMTNYSINFSEEHSKVYSTAMVLSDIGMHDLSKKFKKILPE